MYWQGKLHSENWSKLGFILIVSVVYAYIIIVQVKLLCTVYDLPKLNVLICFRDIYQSLNLMIHFINIMKQELELLCVLKYH